MIDKQRLIDALLYENMQPFYRGNLLQDAAMLLQNSIEDEDYKKELKRTVRSECLSQLPEEDFLCDIIKKLYSIKTLKKSEIIEKVSFIIECLEDKQQCQLNASAYAYTTLEDL